MNRRWPWLAGGLAVLVLANLAVNPWFARQRSLLLMSGYDWAFERRSVPQQTGVGVEMPLRGSGLYPLMITFNADQPMSEWLGADVSFTVEFTFADFAPRQGHSGIFDPDHPLYGTYVGSYYLHGLGRPLSTEEVARVAEFDQRVLALPALGLGFDDNRFEVLATSTQPVGYAGLEWTSHDATVLTNCPDHSPDGFELAHLQFGTPPRTDRHYPVCELAARIDVTWLPDQDLTVGTYIMAPSSAEVDRLSAEVVRQAAVSRR